jgi:hypothetical protein
MSPYNKQIVFRGDAAELAVWDGVPDTGIVGAAAKVWW